MSITIVYTRASSGIDAPLVTVETHLSAGMPGFHIVGLPETAVKESRDRVRSALLHSNFEFPTRRITINLAPADLPKEGGRFDLPIALGILSASGQIATDSLHEYEFTAELALSGELRFVKGILPVVLASKKIGRKLIIADANAFEAAIVKKASVFSARHLLEVCAFLNKTTPLPQCSNLEFTITPGTPKDLEDVYGQMHAKRALEISAAGKHSLLLIGPPGTGKTMLASRLPGISPALTEEQALEVAAIASISYSGFNPSQWQEIPFRSPHHSSSGIALVGGGRPPKPGEISLAHHGILFLDELPEFNRHVLECLREPLESGHITISRAAFQTVFPSKFQLIAAMNPCPCGYAGSQNHHCRCTMDQINKYRNKLSGPFLDRIDMHVEVPSLPSEAIFQKTKLPTEKSQDVKARVLQAREIQIERQQKCNQALEVSEIKQYCQLELDAEKILLEVIQKYQMSARVSHRILKISRTIADLANKANISMTHLSEALTFRCLDKIKKI